MKRFEGHSEIQFPFRLVKHKRVFMGKVKASLVNCRTLTMCRLVGFDAQSACWHYRCCLSDPTYFLGSFPPVLHEGLFLFILYGSNYLFGV